MWAIDPVVKNEDKHYRVCGYLEDVAPGGNDGKTPLFECCQCCGVEHGYQDTTLDSSRQYRANWLANGAKWNSVQLKPVEWSLERQLSVIPRDFV